MTATTRYLLLALLLSLTSALTFAQAPKLPLEGQRLTDNWFFVKGDSSAGKTTPPAADAGWSAVTIPHTWNAIDGETGPKYYRGPGWYKTTLTLPPLRDGERAYLRFEAVSTAADVYFNGKHLGEHLGGFNAFTFEITPLARAGANELLVRADNSPRRYIAPLSGDFTVFGGIYRPVHLIIKPATSFNLLDHGTSGIDIEQTSVTPEKATLRVTATVTTSAAQGAKVVVYLTLNSERGTVATAQEFVELAPNETRSITQTLTLNNPHLWQGIDDPYLYTLDAKLLTVGNDNPSVSSVSSAPSITANDVIALQTLDHQQWPVGFRFITIDPQHGFFLNGKPYKLHGVARHQDRPDKGWAISDADHAEDVRIMREMGVNAVRLAHYPQSDVMYDDCLRAGLLVWAENPLVNGIGNPVDPKFVETTKTQLLELIRQRRNFSNIFTWSLSNELHVKPENDTKPPIVSILNDLAHKEDPTRPTTLAVSLVRDCKYDGNFTDIFAFNGYPGWYTKLGEMPKLIADYNAAGNNRGLAISEYGAGASIYQHELGMTKAPKASGTWHPEEWQAIFHEQNYPVIAETPAIWGSFVWNMFDFANAARHDGYTPARNDKGLVTYDRQTRKDAFYYYKANWSKDPVLYITSRRYTDRKDAKTEVKAYTNAPGPVTLTINGRPIGTAKPDAYHIVRWQNVTLAPGSNEVTITAQRDGHDLRDTCTWILLPPGEIPSERSEKPDNPKTPNPK